MSKKKKLEEPYVGCEMRNDLALLYSRRGDYSVILKIKNPVQQFSADIDSYYDFHYIMQNVIKLMGAGCTIQKQDVISKQIFSTPKGELNYLTRSYFQHFAGREYNRLDTYLVLTGENLKKKFLSFDNAKFNSFILNVKKVQDFLNSRKIDNYALNRDETIDYLYRFFTLTFDKKTYSFNNFKATYDDLKVGEKNVRSIALVNIT